MVPKNPDSCGGMNEEVQGPKSSTDNSNVHLTDRYDIYGVFGSSGVMFNPVRARIDTLPGGTLFDDIIVSDLRLFSWGLSFAQTQPSLRAVRVFFLCSTCVCLQLHVDILLRDIKGSKGKLPRKACGGSWRVVSELKVFAD